MSFTLILDVDTDSRVTYLGKPLTRTITSAYELTFDSYSDVFDAYFDGDLVISEPNVNEMFHDMILTVDGDDLSNGCYHENGNYSLQILQTVEPIHIGE